MSRTIVGCTWSANTSPLGLFESFGGAVTLCREDEVILVAEPAIVGGLPALNFFYPTDLLPVDDDPDGELATTELAGPAFLMAA